MDNSKKVKKYILEYFNELEKSTPEDTIEVLNTYMSVDYFWEGVYPFLDQKGVYNVVESFWKPLKKSISHLQRRQDIFMAGEATDGKNWVMSMGQFMGLFDQEFIGIKPTYKIQHLQYAEFSCVENGKITHTAMFVDLIGFMNEAGQYPLPPMTGNYFIYPGPREHNGLIFEEAPRKKTLESFKIVDDMINDLQHLFHEDHNMDTSYELYRKYWAEDMIWYGPCGIGAAYTIQRYLMQHHHPFCDNLTLIDTNQINAYFAEGDFVCFYASLEATQMGGFLGLPRGGKKAHMRGDIDVYYCKNGKISENWCFIDIPFWLNEQGLDIFKRNESISNPN